MTKKNKMLMTVLSNKKILVELEDGLLWRITISKLWSYVTKPPMLDQSRNTIRFSFAKNPSQLIIKMRNIPKICTKKLSALRIEWENFSKQKNYAHETLIIDMYSFSTTMHPVFHTWDKKLRKKTNNTTALTCRTIKVI